MNLKDTYNLIAKDWCQDHRGDSWWHDGAEKFVSFLKPNDLVLDVGCGPGHESKFLVDHQLQVIGIDLSEKMIEVAKKEVPEADFRVIDMREIDKMEETFNGIFSKASLLHIPKKEAPEVIKKLAGRLKNGGFFCIIVKEIEPGEKDEEIIKENDYGYKYERFFSYYTADEIKKYFENLNMEIVFENHAKSTHTNWIQVIARKNNSHDKT